jgi:hypothetical protein
MIYFAQLETGAIKIGTTGDMESRLQNLERHYGPMSILKTIPGGPDEETAIHERFAHLRLSKAEQFRPAPELMEFIGMPLLVGANPDAVEAIKFRRNEPVRHARLELPDGDYERLKRVAKANGLPVAAYIRQAVLRQVRRDESEGEGGGR